MINRLLSAAYFQARLLGMLSYVRKAESLFHGTREALEKFQREKFRDLLLYAYHHTAYYRELFDGIGLIRDGQIREEKLDEIPVMTKETVRSEGKRMLSDEAEKRGVYSHHTSGSTGTPL